MTVDQHPVQRDVGADGRNRAEQRNAHPAGGAQQRAHGHGQHLKGIGEAHHPQIAHADFLNGGLVGVDAHDRLRKQQRRRGEHDSHGHHAGQRHAVGAVDAVVVLRAEILGKEQHAAAHEAPVAREQQRRELGAQAHRAHGVLPQRREHHGVHHAARGSQQVLQRHRHGDDGHVFQKGLPFELFHARSPRQKDGITSTITYP